MVTYFIAHFLSGILLGAWFRFAVLLPAFVVVVIEAAVAASFNLFAPWYAILLAGIVALQFGYTCACVLRPRRSEHPHPAARPSVSTPE
jgi:hypothetical protein